jgi:hypothetical protein
MAIVVDHFNEENWTILVGNNHLVDSLLNKTLVRVHNHRYNTRNPLYWTSSSWKRNIPQYLLSILILAQWGLLLAASALQDWNAVFISLFVVICASTSAFIFGTPDSIRGWLHSNGVGMEKMRVMFSSRRSMLSAMVMINGKSSTSWIDPILAPSQNRADWETALAQRIRSGVKSNDDRVWIESIEEGVQMADEITQWLQDREPSQQQPEASTEVDGRLSGNRDKVVHTKRENTVRNDDK